ncbi:unnamed protein product [Cunninghamella echinulata]
MGDTKQTQKGSKTIKSGLCIPVSKVEDMLRKEAYAYQYNSLTSVYFTAVLEYVIFELFESAAYITIEEDKKVVTAYHFLKGIAHDELLYQLIGGKNSVIAHRHRRYPRVKRKNNYQSMLEDLTDMTN